METRNEPFQIKNTNDLFAYLLSRAEAKPEIQNWFGFKQQRIAGVDLAYRIATKHADTMSPEQVVQYVVDLNNAIYTKIIKG